MSWSDPDEDHWQEAFGDADDETLVRWPLTWRGLYPQERWLWFEHVWSEVCMLRERYRLPVRSGWWENEIQLETLAALGAWVERYDSREWDDPPGKLALLYDIERVAALLRDGVDPFNSDRDRAAFLRYLTEAGCQEPPAGPANGHDPGTRRNGHRPHP